MLSIDAKCKHRAKGCTLLDSVSSGRHNLYYFRAVLYWFKVLTQPPVLEEDGVPTTTSEMKELSFGRELDRDAALAILASNLFALYYTTWSSCQVVNSPDLMFPVNLSNLVAKFADRLQCAARRLVGDVQVNSTVQTRQYSARGRTYEMRKQYFFFKRSKAIIDEIDHILAEHYGFTDEELDFIINYDIKYRMGDEISGEDDE